MATTLLALPISFRFSLLRSDNSSADRKPEGGTAHGQGKKHGHRLDLPKARLLREVHHDGHEEENDGKALQAHFRGPAGRSIRAAFSKRDGVSLHGSISVHRILHALQHESVYVLGALPSLGFGRAHEDFKELLICSKRLSQPSIALDFIKGFRRLAFSLT